jgi:hypothetical protein
LIGDHSCECTSSDQDRHPYERDENTDAVEGGIGNQSEMSIFSGAWHRHQEIQAKNCHDGPRYQSEEDLEALSRPAEEDANSHGHAHVEHDADPPGRSGYCGNQCQEQEPDQKRGADGEQPPQQYFRDSVITSRSRRIRHYATLACDRLLSLPSLCQRTGRLRMTRAESSVHEPSGNARSSSNMLEAM